MFPRTLYSHWRRRRAHHAFAIVCAFLVLSCGTGIESDRIAIHKIAFIEGLSVALTADPGEPSSGEAGSMPELVYTGRSSRVAVTLTDSDTGLPVGAVHVAAKVIATRWIGAPRTLVPVSLQNGVHEGGIELPRHGPYRIDVEIEWPSGRSTVQFGFDY